MKQWYEELFENYADGYDKEAFTQGTQQEVDFLEQELGQDRSLRILDVGCGTGRHSIELARRGYPVVGVDLSESLLNRARQKASLAGVRVEFLHRDARRLDFEGGFDLAILICEGAFPLMETDAMNYQILKNARAALNSKGKLILTTLNALYPLHHSVDDFLNGGGETPSHQSSFDLLTFRMHSVFDVTDDAGLRKSLECNERYYAPSEISWLLATLGFGRVEIFGCRPGGFSRARRLGSDDFEMLVVAAL